VLGGEYAWRGELRPQRRLEDHGRHDDPLTSDEAPSVAGTFAPAACLRRHRALLWCGALGQIEDVSTPPAGVAAPAPAMARMLVVRRQRRHTKGLLTGALRAFAIGGTASERKSPARSIERLISRTSCSGDKCSVERRADSTLRAPLAHLLGPRAADFSGLADDATRRSGAQSPV
jgi:hypothetical protein